MYENFPIYQRNKVWPLRYCQWEINSILEGKPFPSLIAYREIDKQGKQTYWITDGRQRLCAILDFIDGKFRTWTVKQKEQADPNSSPPIEPNKYFNALSPIAKNFLFDYVVSIMIEVKRSDAEMREQFRSFQNHVALTAAEKIDSYLSKAKDAATRIEHHTFWEDFYDGKDQHRKKLFQSSLFLLALEMSPDGFAGVDGNAFIHMLASGRRDHEITSTIVEKVLTRLDAMCHFFQGAQFTIRASAVVMYQGVYFLEKNGVAIQSKNKGSLTMWLCGVMDESSRIGNTPAYNRPLQQITRKKVQYAFWERHLGTIISLAK